MPSNQFTDQALTVVAILEAQESQDRRGLRSIARTVDFLDLFRGCEAVNAYLTELITGQGAALKASVDRGHGIDLLQRIHQARSLHDAAYAPGVSDSQRAENILGSSWQWLSLASEVTGASPKSLLSQTRSKFLIAADNAR